jgi:hypothetical protein
MPMVIAVVAVVADMRVEVDKGNVRQGVPVPVAGGTGSEEEYGEPGVPRQERRHSPPPSLCHPPNLNHAAHECTLHVKDPGARRITTENF